MTAPENPQTPRKRHWLRYFLSFVLLILIIWGGVRACSGNGYSNSKKPYRIALERISNTAYVSGKEANIEAFEKEIIRTIAKQKEFRIKLTTVSSDTAFIGLEQKQFDAVVTLLIPDENTKKIYDFSDPLYRLGAVLIIHPNDNYNSLAQLEGKIIGIPRDVSTFFDVGNYQNLIFYSYDDELDALDDLLANKVDAVIMNAWSAYVNAQGLYRGKIKIATEPFTHEGIRIITPIHSRFAKIIPLFNQGLEQLKQSGTYHDILNKWGLVDTEVSQE